MQRDLGRDMAFLRLPTQGAHRSTDVAQLRTSPGEIINGKEEWSNSLCEHQGLVVTNRRTIFTHTAW